MNDTRPVDEHNTAAALVAVELAMRVINPETRAYAQRLHAGFLTARGIDQSVIDDHWRQLAPLYELQ